MTLTRSFLAVVAFILVTGPIDADEPTSKADQAKQDLEALQGTWLLEENESLFFYTGWMDSGPFPHFGDLETYGTIEIKEDKLRYGEKLEHEVAIILGMDAGKKTITFKRGDTTPIIGIYEFEESVWRVCAVDPTLGGGKKEDVRLPERCGRTRIGWFAQFERSKP